MPGSRQVQHAARIRWRETHENHFEPRRSCRVGGNEKGPLADPTDFRVARIQKRIERLLAMRVLPAVLFSKLTSSVSCPHWRDVLFGYCCQSHAHCTSLATGLSRLSGAVVFTFSASMPLAKSKLQGRRARIRCSVRLPPRVARRSRLLSSAKDAASRALTLRTPLDRRTGRGNAGCRTRQRRRSSASAGHRDGSGNGPRLRGSDRANPHPLTRSRV